MTRRDLTSETAQDTFDVEAEAKRRGIQPYQVRATQAVGDRLMADIVADARKGISQSASMISDRQRSEEKPRPASGGSMPIQPPPGINIIDRMCDAQDRIDRAAAMRVRVETELAEALMKERISYKAKTEYHTLQRFDDEVPSFHREKP